MPAPNLSQRYEEVSSNLMLLTETMGRIDERVAIFVEKIENLEHKMDTHMEACPARCKFNELITRLSILESKNGKDVKEFIKELKTECEAQIRSLQTASVRTSEIIHSIQMEQQSIKESTKRGENKWRTLGWIALNIIVPIIWVIVASAILYHLGIASPPTP
jgi:chromosome segregation ATPase